MAAGDNYRRIDPSDQLVFDANGRVIGLRSGKTDSEARLLTAAELASVKTSCRRTEAAVKLLGSVGNGTLPFNQTASLSTSAITTTQKQEMEAQFAAVRLCIVNRAQNAIDGNTAVVGVSETNSTSSSANMGTPVIGGTAYAAVASAGSVNGWRAVTWGGAADVDVAASTTAQVFSLSDWIPLSSIARADGGSRPLLLWRSYRDGAASGNWSFNTIGTGSRTATAAMRERTFVASNAFSDAVTTLNATMSLTTTVQPIFPIVRFKVPVLSVWGVGDSTMQCSGQAPESLSAWGHRACCDVSTPTAPVVWANFGGSSQTAETAWAVAKSALAAGVPPPSVLVVQPASVNDDATPDVRTRETQLATAADVIATAATYRIPYVVWAPLLPYEALNAAQDTIRKGTNTEMAAMAAAHGVHWLDFSALGDGASPEQWVSGYNDGTGAAGDGIHPDEGAFDAVMTPALTRILRGI